MRYEWVMLLLFEQGTGPAEKITWTGWENHRMKRVEKMPVSGFRLPPGNREPVTGALY